MANKTSDLSHSLLFDYEKKTFTIVQLGPIQAEGGCATVASSIEVVTSPILHAVQKAEAHHLVIKQPLPNESIDPFEIECTQKYGSGVRLVVDLTQGKRRKQVFTTTAFEGSLLHAIKQKKINQDEVYQILDAIAENLERMHKDGIVHGDLKPENVLFRRNKAGKVEVQISDFGLACRVNSKKKRACESYGTYAYTAPELFKNSMERSGHSYSATEQKKHDIYAFGLIARMLLLPGDPCWFDLSDTLSSSKTEKERHKTMAEIYENQRKPIAKVKVKVKEEDKELLTGLLNHNPNDRMTLKDARRLLA